MGMAYEYSADDRKALGLPEQPLEPEPEHEEIKHIKQKQVSKMSYKLQLWETDESGDFAHLHDEVDVHEDEFEYAKEDGDAATLLLGNLQIGRLL